MSRLPAPFPVNSGRCLAVALLLVLLLAAAGSGGCSCRQPQEETGGMDPDAPPAPPDGATEPAPPSLAELWAALVADTPLASGRPVLTNRLAFSLDEAGRFDVLRGTLYAAAGDTATVYHFSLREGEADPTVRGGQRQVIVDEQRLVDIVDLWTCLDGVEATAPTAGSGDEPRAGVAALVSPGCPDPTFFADVSWDNAQVLPPNPYEHWSLLDEGRTTPIDLKQGAMAVAGRRTVLTVRDPAVSGNKYCLLADLSDPVEALGNASPALSLSHRDWKNGDFDGDGEPEYVYICGLRPGESRTSTQLGLLVSGSPDGVGTPLRLDNSPQGGAIEEVACTARDLTGDGLPELVVSWASGRDLYRWDLAVYRIAAYPPAAERLFACWEAADPGGMNNAYLGDGRVRVAVDSAGLAWELELSDRPADYDRRAREGFAAAGIAPFQYRFEIADRDGDGLAEITGRRAVWGIDESDIIGYLDSTFGWDDKAGEFVLQGLELTPGAYPSDPPLEPVKATAP